MWGLGKKREPRLMATLTRDLAFVTSRQGHHDKCACSTLQGRKLYSFDSQSVFRIVNGQHLKSRFFCRKFDNLFFLKNQICHQREQLTPCFRSSYSVLFIVFRTAQQCSFVLYYPSVVLYYPSCTISLLTRLI